MKPDCPERYFCKDNSGIDLFFVDLFFIPEQGIIFLEFSFNYNWSISNINRVVDQISTEIFNDERRLCLIAVLFIMVKNATEISTQVFRDQYPEMDDIYKDSYTNVLNDIIASKDFPDYSVFSKTSNAIYYNILREYIENAILSDSGLEKVDKLNFEMHVAKNSELALAYVEHLVCNLKYFVLKKEKDCEICNFYFMAESSKVILIFIVKESS